MKTSSPYRLRITLGPQAGQKAGQAAAQLVELSKNEVIVGRGLDSDVIINHPEASRRHVRLTYQEKQYFIEDLGSANGTYINGTQLAGRTALHSGDHITLGKEISL